MTLKEKTCFNQLTNSNITGHHFNIVNIMKFTFQNFKEIRMKYFLSSYSQNANNMR